MKKMLPLLMAVLTMILLLGFAAPASADTLEVGNAIEFGDNLTAANSGDIIQLTADITYTDPISITAGMTITFDVNGHTLTVQNDSAIVLTVNGGVLILEDSTGGGEFNVISDDIYSAVNILNGGTATVTNAISDTASVVNVTGGTLTLLGNVTGNGYGVYAAGSSIVTIDGVINADPYIAFSDSINSKGDYTKPFDDSLGYLEYTDGTSYVYLRAVCQILDTSDDVSETYNDLDDALDDVNDDETIKLLADINYNSGIFILDKSFTFDVNGFILNVRCSNDDVTESGAALEVSDGKV